MAHKNLKGVKSVSWCRPVLCGKGFSRRKREKTTPLRILHLEKLGETRIVVCFLVVVVRVRNSLRLFGGWIYSDAHIHIVSYCIYFCHNESFFGKQMVIASHISYVDRGWETHFLKDGNMSTIFCPWINLEFPIGGTHLWLSYIPALGVIAGFFPSTVLIFLHSRHFLMMES